MLEPISLHRFRDLQSYIGWTDDDANRVRSVAPYLRAGMPELVNEFCRQIDLHPITQRVVVRCAVGTSDLKRYFSAWLEESLEARHDADYLARRWRIGYRHAEVGVPPAYTRAALARLRNGVVSILAGANLGSFAEFCYAVQSYNRLLDLDLAIINDAYEVERLRREVRSEYERGEIKFRKLVETAALLVVIIRADLGVVYCSPFSETFTGRRLVETGSDRFLRAVMPGSSWEGVHKLIVSAFAGEKRLACDSTILCADGCQRWVAWSAQRLDDFEGETAVLMVGRDDTDRREASDRMLRAERLAAIGQMITGLAHESRNALQRIQACGELMELEVAGNENALHLVRRMQEAQDQLRRLFDEVRDYAAPISLERGECRLDTVWREAWNLLEAARSSRTARLVEASREINLEIVGDRFRLVQLFRNIFENSLAACADPVEIRIHCANRHTEHGDALEVRISDNGPGLSPEARHGVFEPFFTTKTKGTGLGMAIARRIVEAHSGQIDLADDPRPDVGAEFIVVLPRI